jgi:putative DNA primase/helicase
MKTDQLALRPQYEALAAAAHGWPVFPCDPNLKKPLVGSAVAGGGGVKLATTDPDQIGRWWKEWPSAMIGMRCGSKADGGAGVVVIDLDPKDDVTAAELLAKLCAYTAKTLERESYALPPCPMVETPRGGLHLWFKYPEEAELEPIKNRLDFLRAVSIRQVDVRANGGYVIIPNSTRRGPKAAEENCHGVSYRWAEDAAPSDLGLPELPAELIKLITMRHGDAGDAGVIERKGPAVRPAPLPSSASAELDPRQRAIEAFIAAAVDGEIARVRTAPEGTRNATLNNAALSLGHHVKAGRLAEGLVRDLLLKAADDSGLIKDDGLRAVELTIDSGLRAADAQPPATYHHVGTLAGRSLRPPPIVAVPDYIAAVSSPPSPRPPEAGGKPLGRDRPVEMSAIGAKAAGGGLEPPAGPPPPGMDDLPPDDGEGPPGPTLLDLETLRTCFQFRLNDTGNSERLRTWFGAEFLNVDIAENPSSGLGVHVWSGKHWDGLTGYRTLQRLAQTTAERIHSEAELFKFTEEELEQIEARREVLRRAPHKKDRSPADLAIVDDGDKAIKNLRLRKGARKKFALSSGNGPRLNHMISQSLPHCTVQPHVMDSDPLLINLENGTLAIIGVHDPECPDENCKGECGRTVPGLELRPHDRANLISKVMPVSYDPQATAPKFLAFAQRCQPNAENLAFLRRWYGLSTTGLTEQAFLLNYGTGANGKTAFIETIARMLGPYAQTLPAEALVGDQQRRGDQATPELARLQGARLVTAAELPRGQGFREGTLKMLTGGDAMPVRQLHGKFWDLRPIFKAVGTCNEKPDIHGVDEGIWRRVKLIPWEYVIPLHERRKLEEVLAEFDQERSGILNWLLGGLLDYLTGGLQVPQAVLDATESYREDMDPVGAFVSACVTVFDKGSGREVRARAMYEAYQAFCHENSIRPFSAKNLSNILGQKGIKKIKDSSMKYIDVELHDVPADPDKSRMPAMRGIGYVSSATAYADIANKGQ